MIEEEFLAESRSLIKCMSFTFFLSDSLWRPSQRSWVQEKKYQIDCTSFGSIEICYSTIHWTKCYAFSSSSCKYMIWSLWPRSCIYRFIAAFNVNYCRPNHYCRGIIEPAQTKIGKCFFPTIYFEFAIHLQQQFTCTWEVLRSLYVLHTYILDKQGRYKWYSKIHCSL